MMSDIDDPAGRTSGHGEELVREWTTHNGDIEGDARVAATEIAEWARKLYAKFAKPTDQDIQGIANHKAKLLVSRTSFPLTDEEFNSLLERPQPPNANELNARRDSFYRKAQRDMKALILSHLAKDDRGRWKLLESAPGRIGAAPEIPAYCKDRPTYKGIVIPFFALIDSRGVPDFKIVDPHHLDECIDRKLCGICGTHLGRKMFFIGGPKSTENGVYTDPPMHEACARYSMAVCPFLLGMKGYAQHVRSDIAVMVDQNMSTERPAEMFMTAARGFEVHRVGGATYFKITRRLTVEPFGSLH